MGRVLSNNVGLAYAEEDTLGVLPSAPAWKAVEPNTVGAFGATISRTPRNPISKNRQRRKGAVTDLDSAAEFDADVTLDSFRDFIQGFLFADAVNSDVTNLPVSTVAGGATDSYSLTTALVLAQVSRFPVGALVWASGFSNSDNNGLRVLDTIGGATIAVEEDLQADTTGVVSFAGYQFATAATWTYSATSKQGTLQKTGLGTTLIAMGLEAGMFVHFGSVASAGAAVANGLSTAGIGYGRVVSVINNNLVLDKLSTALQGAITVTGNTHIVLGQFIRNVPTDDPRYEERSFALEATFPGLGDAGVTEYQYSRGNFCNTLTFTLPLTDKATLGFAFIGTDTDNPTLVQEAGANAATTPTATSPFNTSSDIARLRITEVDEDALTTDFKSITLTMTNNVSPEKVLANLGARFMNAGNFEVNIESQLVFTSSEVIERIRSNETVSMDFILNNDNGVIVVDIPSMTLGGGDREFPANESVLVNTTGEAFEDDSLGSSIGISILPVPLP